MLHFTQYICKTHNDVQPLIDIQSSNPRPISKSQTSVPQIYVLFQILKLATNSQIHGPFSLSQIDVQ